MDTILISGATGYIGKKLLQSIPTDTKTFIISRRCSISKLSNVSKKYEVIYTDELESKRFDFTDTTFIHLASHNTFNDSEYKLIIDTNINFSLDLINFYHKNGGHRVINIGSYWEDYQNIIDNPNSLYAQSKISFRKIINKIDDLIILNIKLFDITGPEDNRRKIFNLISNAAHNSYKLELTAGEQYINLSHVEDICQGILTANNIIKKQITKHATFFLKDDRNYYHLKEIINEFIRINNFKIELIWGARKYSKRDFFDKLNCYDNLPNFTFKHDLTSTLEAIS